MQRFIFGVLCIVLFSASSALADFYRYVDKDGREFFVSDLKQVPQAYQKSATVVKPDAGRVTVGEAPAVTNTARPGIKEHKDKYGRGEAHWRNRADKLRKQLRALQDKYDLVVAQEKDLDGQPRKLTDKKRKSIAKSKAQLAKKITQKKRELEVELPDAARKADAYPGWIRE